jgi:hypothetical protein
MLRSQAILLVFPVPFTALDARGMPSGAVRFDPPTGRKNQVHFIGCTRKNTLVEKRKRAEGRQSLYNTSFRYDLTPQRITHTDYHVRRIRQGELIAADPATAKIAGVPFVPPTTAFERARYAAIARWEQQYGEPPPVEKWPPLQLIVPDDESTPPTAPAHAASLRAKGAAPPSAAPAPAPPVAPPNAPVPPPQGFPRAAAPATAFAGTPLPDTAAGQAAPAPNAAAEPNAPAPDAPNAAAEPAGGKHA